MRTFNVAEAKAHLSQLIDAAVAGEEIVIARRDVPLVKLVPVAPRVRKTEIGRLRGRGTIAPDFDAPLPDFEPYRR